MKRSGVGLEAVADWQNLAAAFARAVAGSRGGEDANLFRRDLDGSLAQLRHQILTERVVVGEMTSFCIRDPKTRIIHAPCFRERVLHHALMAHVGPVLDRTLVDDTYACRKGKGGLAAVHRCQQHVRRFPWYVQIDIRGFFAAVDHGIMLTMLHRKFKNSGLLHLLERIVHAYETGSGCGLPIGALTSQHFANFYLAGLDRLLLEIIKVRGMVRYMDDLLWCCDSKAEAQQSLHQARNFIGEQLALEIKESPRIGPSRNGTLFCGYRVLPGRLLLSRRRKQRYAERRRYWENLYEREIISSLKLQAGYAAAFAITSHADAIAWRREQLRRRPSAGLLGEV